MNSRKPRHVPRFKTEAEERKFWETHDSADYIDWSKAKRTHFPKLKPKTEMVANNSDPSSHSQ
jgi:hypothetical protein